MLRLAVLLTLSGFLALAGGAPSSPSAGSTVVGGPPQPSLGAARSPEPYKTRCINRCLEKFYLEAGCAHAHDWPCLCVREQNGKWEVASRVYHCFNRECGHPDDMSSRKGISKSHCGKHVAAIASEDVWGNLRSQMEGTMDSQAKETVL